MLAGLNAAHIPQPNCGTQGAATKSSSMEAKGPPLSQDTHIHPCGIRVTERGWWTTGDWVGEWVPVAGTAPAGTAGRGMGSCQGAGARCDVGPAFSRLFSAFQGSGALWWRQGVGRWGCGCSVPVVRLWGSGWAEVAVGMWR